MLKTATAASILVAFLACPMTFAQVAAPQQDDGGFGGPQAASEPTNTQLDESWTKGDEPLAPPGETAKTNNNNRNKPNLAPARFAIVSEPGVDIKSKPARYAILSEPGLDMKNVPDARYAVLSETGAGGALSSKATGGVPLPPARYAPLSGAPIGDSLNALQQLSKELPIKTRASEGF
jgi:hypothetical protein